MHPGAYFPEQFGKTEEERIKNLARAFKKNDIEVDRDGTIIPKKVKNERIMGKGITTHICKKLTKKGCRLPENERPYECRTVQVKDDRCIQRMRKSTVVSKWEDQQHVIAAAKSLSNHRGCEPCEV